MLLNLTGRAFRVQRTAHEPYVVARKALPVRFNSIQKGDQFRLVFSEGATRVDVCLYDAQGRQADCITLRERTAFVWHGFINGIKPGQLYNFRVDGPWAPEQGFRFNYNKSLVDPYAKAISGNVDWKEPIFPYDLASGDPLQDGHAGQCRGGSKVCCDRRPV